MAGSFRLQLLSAKQPRELVQADLSAPGTISLGRSDDAEIFLKDPAVEPVHCQIHYGPHGVRLDDRGSALGTLRNGVRVQDSVALEDGDEIRIGNTAFRVGIDDHRGSAPEARPRMNAPPFEPSRGPGGSPVEPHGGRPAGAPADRTIVIEPSQIPRQQPSLVIPLQGEVTVIGRDPQTGFRLWHPAISRQHAEIIRRPDHFQVRDLGSANGTFLNGQRLTGRSRLRPGDRLQIGPFEWVFDGALLSAHGHRSTQTGDAVEGTRIQLREIGKQVTDPKTGKLVWLLEKLNLSILPQEFVGVIGSSGCGKSTLMDVMNGRRPATHGTVLYNSRNLYNSFDAFKSGIGYVPQELIFHRELCVTDALRYSAQLRLPPDTSSREIEENIERVLQSVGLQEQRQTEIDKLSGGQKKRVSIAIELLSRPNVLFLDEATSGLDLLAEAEMMAIFRDVANSGVTTLCITHYAHSLDRCDMVLYLYRGRLAYFGPPRMLMRYFGVKQLGDVFHQEKQATPEEWATRYAASDLYKEYVERRAREAPPVIDEETLVKPGEAIDKLGRTEQKKQLRVLVKRYCKVLTGDWRSLLLMLCLAPLIAGLIRYRFAAPDDVPIVRQALDTIDNEYERKDAQEYNVLRAEPPPDSAGRRHPTVRAQIEFEVRRTTQQVNLCFAATVGMFFLGIFGSIREVVKELAIYRHERFVNLQIPSYLASKITVLGTINLLQSAAMLGCLRWQGFLGIEPASEVYMFLALFLTAFVAMLLGLAVSCAVDNADKAILIMIVLIIPQILFMEALTPLAGLRQTLGMALIPCYWAFDLSKSMLLPEYHAPVTVARQAYQWAALLGFAVLYTAMAAFFLRMKDARHGKAYVIPFVESGRTLLGKAKAAFRS